jgi:hypothetical protein
MMRSKRSDSRRPGPRPSERAAFAPCRVGPLTLIGAPLRAPRFVGLLALRVGASPLLVSALAIGAHLDAQVAQSPRIGL